MKKLLGISIDSWLEIKDFFQTTDAQGLTFSQEKYTISITRKQQSTSSCQSIPTISPENVVQPLLKEEPDLNDSYSDKEKYEIITSPIMGTYYDSSSPTSAPFVEIGSVVSAGSTLCIIEAMKIYNEIKSPVSGTITAILKKKGAGTVIDDKLFIIQKG